MTPKISAGQTACLLIISRIIVSLTYSPSFFTGGYGSVDILAFALTLPVTALQFIPVLLLYKRGGSVVTVCYERSRTFGVAVAVSYALFLIWTASVTVARFDVFISTSVFSQYVFYGFMLPCVLAFFAALKGIEGIARASVAVVILIIAAVLLLFATGFSSFDTNNLLSFDYYGNGALFRSFLSSLSRSMEAAILCVLLQFVKTKLRKACIIYMSVSFITVVLVLLTVILVIGDFSFITMFPYDSAAGNVSRWSFLDLEPLLIFVWIIGVFIKCSVCITLAAFCLEKIIKNIYVRSGVSAALVMAISFALARDIGGYPILFTPAVSLTLIAVFSFVLPIAALVFGGKRCLKN
ncbi:MAG: GerAB/ArcD/ProY family transporter [Clostridia bacterium]|nr:GerAB/ArcD/ProY family transporter [Clostridia bacterium]